VHKEGKIYTLAYGNAASFHIDPIEKKPLYHFLPSTPVFSLATSGCSFRCLNCQNWELSQKRPEQLKVAEGPDLQLTVANARRLTRADVERASLFPDAVVDFAVATACASIAYTYSEPTSFYEYMLDTARAAREKGIKNVWVTNGYMCREPLEELAQVLDAANVDLKSFSALTYETLNGGQLQPVLDTLKTLRAANVWVEVTNLMVPTYTDDPDETRRLCDWIVEHLGPDVPIHFSRFHPQYKLDHLPATPPGVLIDAKRIAHEAGLHFAYLGNVRGIPDAATTLCPSCGKAVLKRRGYNVLDQRVAPRGECGHCGKRVAGVWG
jgi:pyruvate formate lyase activating enzyme